MTEDNKVECSKCKQIFDRDDDDIGACEHCGNPVCRDCATVDEDLHWYCEKCTNTMVETDLCLIELDETENWDEDFLDGYKIKAITTVYLFDRNLHTYCCETTYSYWLIPLYFNVIMEDNTTDQERECAYHEVDEQFCMIEERGYYYNHYDIDEKMAKWESNEPFDDYTSIYKIEEENFTHFPLQEGGIGQEGHINQENVDEYNKKMEKIQGYCCETHHI